MFAYRLKFQIISIVMVPYVLAMLVGMVWVNSRENPNLGFALLSSSTQLPDLKNISDIPTRKQAFLSLLAPLVNEKNRNVMALRKEVIAMQAELAADSELSRAQQRRLKALAKRYRLVKDIEDASAESEESSIDDDAGDELAEKDLNKLITQLLLRIDQIPVAMVLAQGAAESGWGTSRFANEAQNLFGQWCYRKGCGIKPANRVEGARHEVRSFDDVEAAVDAYFININTHRAYRELRNMRAQLRTENKALDAHILIQGLGRYSSRGQVYVEELAELIRFNSLEQYEIFEPLALNES